jgi:hypothetical protein
MPQVGVLFKHSSQLKPLNPRLMLQKSELLAPLKQPQRLTGQYSLIAAGRLEATDKSWLSRDYLMVKHA